MEEVSAGVATFEPCMKSIAPDVYPASACAKLSTECPMHLLLNLLSQSGDAVFRKEIQALFVSIAEGKANSLITLRRWG